MKAAIWIMKRIVNLMKIIIRMAKEIMNLVKTIIGMMKNIEMVWYKFPLSFVFRVAGVVNGMLP